MTNNSPYYSIDRIKLFMGYDLSKTYSENQKFISEQYSNLPGVPSIPQDEPEIPLEPGEVDVKSHRKIEGFKTILMPNGRATYIPNDATITGLFGDNITWRDFGSTFKKWEKTQWQDWIPYQQKDIKGMAQPSSVSSFKLKDGTVYKANFKNPYFKKEDSKPIPWGWQFYAYEDEKGNPYIPPKSEGNFVINWIKDNSETISIIAAQIVVAVLTQGMSLTAQAWALFGVDVAVFLKELVVDKDAIGAVIGLLVGLIPVAGRIAKFGVANPVKFLKTHGRALSRIRTHSQFKAFYTLLEDEEKILIRRAIEQVPGEVKKFTNKNIATVMRNALKDSTIDWKKIPLKQMLWWKQLFVESGLQIGTQMAAEIAFRQDNLDPEQERKLEEKFNEGIKTSSETTNVLDSLEKVQKSGGYFQEIK